MTFTSEVSGWLDANGQFHEVPNMGHYDYIRNTFEIPLDPDDDLNDPMITALRKGWVQVRIFGQELDLHLFGTTPITRRAVSHLTHEAKHQHEVQRYVVNDHIFDHEAQMARFVSELPCLDAFEDGYGAMVCKTGSDQF